MFVYSNVMLFSHICSAPNWCESTIIGITLGPN